MKNIFLNQEELLLIQMFSGVTKISIIISSTIGPKGRNVIIDIYLKVPSIINDGVTICKKIFLNDTIENLGSKIVIQSSIMTNQYNGDGTSTAILLSSCIISQGLRLVKTRGLPYIVIRGISSAIKLIILRVIYFAIKVTNEKLIRQVATISSGSSITIGRLVSFAICKVGRFGFVSLVDCLQTNDFLKVVRGMQFSSGVVTLFFYKYFEDKTICLKKSYIILFSCYLFKINFFLQLLELMKYKKFKFLIIVRDLYNNLISSLMLNKTRLKLKFVIVRAPCYGKKSK